MEQIKVHFVDNKTIEQGKYPGLNTNFVGCYSTDNKTIYINLDDVQYGKNLKQADYLKSANATAWFITDLMPTLLHETQHAVQDIEFKGRFFSANRVIALILHANKEDFLKFVKDKGNVSEVKLAERLLKDPGKLVSMMDFPFN